VSCTAPQRHGPITTREFNPAVETETEALWTASQDVLREHRFRLDRVDRRAGVVTTQPVTSQQLFEFWRKDVATSYDLLEASMRTVRRWVDVEMAEDDGALRVVVHRETLVSPDRQFNNSVVATRMFGTDLPRADTGEPISEADNYWIDAGRDPAMEQYLLDRIVARAGVVE